MKRILSIVTAVFLAATVMLPIAVPVQAQTEQSLVNPADSRFGSGAPNVISVNATSSGSAIISAEYQALFSNAADTLIAAEIFAQKSLTIPSPRAGAGAVVDNTPVPAGLPPGSIASITVFGTVTMNATSGEWQIGTPPIFVYESLNTSIQGTPGLGSNVRVEAVRTLTPGPIVADKITQLAGGSLPASPPAMDMMFLINGTVESVQSAEKSSGVQLGAETWTVDGVDFRIDDSNSPASIDPGIGLGDGLDPVVTVLFRTPLPSIVSANIALEIHAEDLTGLDQILPTLHPDPVTNTAEAPIQIPAGAWMQFDIDGVVTAVNPDGEWRIGTPPVIVYEGKTTDPDTGLPISATSFGGSRRPVQGDEVRVIAARTLMPGPLVAKQIVFLTGGPLTASAPVTDRSFRFNGAIQTIAADNWTIDNVSFVVNDPLSPAAIESGLAAGDNVTVNFNFIGPLPPESALWASLTLDSTTNLHTAVLTPPAASAEQSGFLFLRATDAQQQVTTTMIPAALLAVPASAPTAPGNLTATAISTTQVNLNWTDASDSEASFRVERATDADFTLNMQSFIVAANSQSFSDTTAPVDTTLFYRLFAVNGAGDSTVAGPVQMTKSSPGGTGGNGSGGGDETTTTVGLSGLTGDDMLKLDSSGKTQNSVKLSNSGPGKPSLEIPFGTTMKTATGAPITSITMSVPDTIPPAPPQNAIVLAQDFGPDGATFSPPITLTLTYAESALPAGAREAELVIAYWDGSAWVTLPTTVNAEVNTVSAKVIHFTVFGVLAKSPSSPPPASSPTPALVSKPSSPPPAPVPPASSPALAPMPTPAPSPAPITPPQSAPAPAPSPAQSPATNPILTIGIAGAVIILIGSGILWRRRAGW